MAGALGMLLGAGLQYASGYANEKLQQKQQQEAAAHSAMQDALANTPGFAETPEGQKALKNMVGPEYAPIVTSALKFKHQMMQRGQQEYQEAMGGAGGSATPSASHQMIGAAGGGGRFSQPQQIVGKVPNQMPPMQVTGPNSPPEPTSVGTAPQQSSAMPNDPATLRDWADRGEQFLGSPEAVNSGFSQEQLNVMKSHVTELRARAKEIEGEQQRALYDSPAAKAAASTASTQAKIDTEHKNAPTIRADAAAKSGAETSARVGVEYSESVIKKKIDAAVREQKAKAEAAGQKPVDPEKAKNALVTRAKNLSAIYTQEHGSSPWLAGKDEYKSDRAKWFFEHDPEVAVTLDLAPSVGATKLPDGNYDKGGKHLYAYKGQVFDLGAVAQ